MGCRRLYHLNMEVFFLGVIFDHEVLHSKIHENYMLCFQV
jgi:hypothetical protein